MKKPRGKGGLETQGGQEGGEEMVEDGKIESEREG